MKLLRSISSILGESGFFGLVDQEPQNSSGLVSSPQSGLNPREETLHLQLVLDNSKSSCFLTHRGRKPTVHPGRFKLKKEATSRSVTEHTSVPLVTRVERSEAPPISLTRASVGPN